MAVNNTTIEELLNAENDNKTAIIGGTGLTALQNLEITRREIVMTPFGEPSAPLCYGRINGSSDSNIIFLTRHGHGHNIPPHMVNYQANIWALKKVGVKDIIAVNAVGGIREDMVPGSLVIPNQIIDYTSRRVNTFFESNLSYVTHIDFTYPYSQNVREMLLDGALDAQIDVIDGATYAATEGPRLETSAEIQRLKNDGCDIVGMTGMPEAALAREMQINYASICVNANWAAGLSDELITMDAIEQTLVEGMAKVRQLITRTIASYC